MLQLTSLIHMQVATFLDKDNHVGALAAELLQERGTLN